MKLERRRSRGKSGMGDMDEPWRPSHRLQWVWMLYSALGVLITGSYAQAGINGISVDAEYQVTYEVSDSQAKTLSRVRVGDTVLIGAREFLIIELPGSPTSWVRGYLDLQHVRSILPVEALDYSERPAKR